MNRAPQFTAGQARLILLGLWALISAWLIVSNWTAIVEMQLRDPDDALRLVQVRDLLAGQSWFDVTQHRVFPPEGGPMHWSRLIDLPIALVIAALQPLFGQAIAERAALTIVPLTQLLALFFVVFALCRTLLLQRGTALIAAAILATSMSILVQFYPNRIDHHGAQILLGGLAMIALVHPTRRDGVMGLLSGLAMAGWLQVSMEGLPAAVAIGAAFGLRSIWRLDSRRDITAYLSALTLGSAALLFATHLPADAMLRWCDSMSPAYLLPLVATTATLILARGAMPGPSVAARTVPLALAGAAGAASFLAISKQCLAGPFGTLDPLVYSTWFVMVREGMPITMQPPEMQLMIALPILLGLPGTIMALRNASNPKVRDSWRCLLFVQVAASLLAFDVMRAMSFAHLLCLPGNAVLLATLMRRAQGLRMMPPRVILTAGTMLLTPFGTAATATALVNTDKASNDKDGQQDQALAARCTREATTRGLDALPPSTLFAPIDISSHLIAYTHHSVVATGHHRNVEGMKQVVHTFMASPDKARAMVIANHADYVVTCPGYNEFRTYARTAPNGLAAALMGGRTPDWLRPVPMRPGETIRVYKVIDPSA